MDDRAWEREQIYSRRRELDRDLDDRRWRRDRDPGGPPGLSNPSAFTAQGSKPFDRSWSGWMDTDWERRGKELAELPLHPPPVFLASGHTGPPPQHAPSVFLAPGHTGPPPPVIENIEPFQFQSGRNRGGYDDERVIYRSLDHHDRFGPYDRLPDTIQTIWNRSTTQDRTLHFELDIEQDLETYVEEFCRLKRLGNFRAAEKYFQENLKAHLHHLTVRLEYAAMLLDRGAYKDLRDLNRESAPVLEMAPRGVREKELLYQESLQLMVAFADAHTTGFYGNIVEDMEHLQSYDYLQNLGGRRSPPNFEDELSLSSTEVGLQMIL